ncbi:hypothetical protein U1E44_15905 [Arenibacter sp. GZD96]|uniref:hypothetical protein n=1 Tax=Aurantibrevibacter litoralis TaxID=3106030 RepID=UPI002AFF83F6|nr:hypothetical protein [Arenibacter sp. GZD-96]MEA1787587.1 hypothetical protein [Arenibacter sp. GZD-96]
MKIVSLRGSVFEEVGENVPTFWDAFFSSTFKTHQSTIKSSQHDYFFIPTTERQIII